MTGKRGRGTRKNRKHKFLRWRQVSERTGLSRSGIYSKVYAGEFPQPFKLGVRAIGWLESDIDDWIDEQLSRGPASIGCHEEEDAAA